MRIFLTILFTSIFSTITLAQSNLERGNKFFDNRFDHIQGNKADHSNIDKAIDQYLKAEDSPEKYIALLQSYEFKGSWTNVTDEVAKETYNKGVELGERVKEKYPDNAAILYWYIANLSRWGDAVSIVEAAEDGILDKIKSVCEKIIELDPAYEEAGALRLLGGIHLKAPEIPFVLTWPSEDKAKELLNKAYDIAPENAANTYYYILMLLNEDKRSKAKSELKNFIHRTPRKDYLLADRKFINKGKELYAEEFE